MILIIPLLYLIFGSVLLVSIINKLYPQHIRFSFFFGFINFPLLTSLTQYALFYFHPGQPNWFYLSVHLTILLSLIFLNIKGLRIKAPGLPQINTVFDKLLAAPIIFILFLCTLRIFFWPINWDDQIYYIEQSYSIGQDKNIERFLDWGYFKNSELQFQINPSIRPGLPLLLSQASLYSPHLQSVVNFSRVITFYYFVILLLFIVFLAKRHALVAVFLTLTCYLFINLSILGFKELILISQILLIIYLISRKSAFSWFQSVLTGVIFGLMAYINYSGSLITGFFFIIFTLFVPGKVLVKFVRLHLFTVLLIVFSGLEFIYFLGIISDGGFRRIDINHQVSSLVQTAKNKLSFNPQLTNEDIPEIDTSGISQNNTSQNELLSYDVRTPSQLYTKGKLQGLFQVQYFGLVFAFFFLTLILRFRLLWHNSLTRFLIIFIASFYIFFIDIFNLNRHQFAVVLSISHKYTALLVPFISILIASQWKWWKNIFYNFNNLFIKLGFLILIYTGITFSMLPEHIFKVLKLIIPIHSTTEHYYEVIRLSGIGLLTALTVLIIFAFLLPRKYFNQYKTFAILTICFFFPFLLFFHTNFGLPETLLNSFSPTPQKLILIPGWNSLYSTVNLLNTLPNTSRFLFVNGNISQLGIHFTFPASNIFTLKSSLEHKTTYEDIDKAVNNDNIDYILVNPKSFRFEKYDLIHETVDYAVYKAKSE